MARKKKAEITPPTVVVPRMPNGAVDLTKLSLQLSGVGLHVATVATSGARVRWWLRTGNTALDRVFGDRRNHGLGSGKLYTLYGLTGTGKSLTAMALARWAQAAGWVVVYVDMERVLSDDVARMNGIDPALLLRMPSRSQIEELLAESKVFTLEAAFESMERTAIEVRRAFPDLPILFLYDSIAASSTTRSAEAEYGTKGAHGDLAAALSQGWRNLRPVFTDLDVSSLWLNQMRVNQKVQFGDPNYQPGGRAAEFYPDVIARTEHPMKWKVQDTNGVQTGETINVAVEKSRLWPGRLTGSFRILYDRGIDDAYSVADMARNFGLIQVAGSWVDGGDVGGRVQGFDKYVDALRAAPDAYEELRRRVLAHDEPEVADAVVPAAGADSPLPGAGSAPA